MAETYLNDCDQNKEDIENNQEVDDVNVMILEQD